MLYGQFVGNWEANAGWHLPDGTICQHWQVHFDWVLEGCAIQDVWITPPRHGPHSTEQSEPWGEFGNQYGTTVRVYDPKIDAWHVTYIDPSYIWGEPNGDIDWSGANSATPQDRGGVGMAKVRSFVDDPNKITGG